MRLPPKSLAQRAVEQASLFLRVQNARFRRRIAASLHSVWTKSAQHHFRAATAQDGSPPLSRLRERGAVDSNFKPNAAERQLFTIGRR
jgi:hypothetical protein